MDKGIVIGAEHEAVARANLPFVMFRHATSVRVTMHSSLQQSTKNPCDSPTSSYTTSYSFISKRDKSVKQCNLRQNTLTWCTLRMRSKCSFTMSWSPSSTRLRQQL
jgi:hypothetical protein